MTPEHRDKISESVKAHYASKNARKYKKAKYPRLPEHLNRTKKISLEDVIRIHEMVKLGFSVTEISKQLGYKYHAVYYHTMPENVRRARNHHSHVLTKQRESEDASFKEQRLKQMEESRKYRRQIHGKEWKDWNAKTYHDRYTKNPYKRAS